jgi:prepilin-type N-terminal cleavage/methylation domain-containing protein
MKSQTHSTPRRAFTLIELLTVIAIIGILAGIIIPTTAAVRISAKKTQTKAQFAQITNSLNLYKNEYGYYPIIPYSKLNGNLAPDATSISTKSRQMLMLEVLTGRDADPSTALFESDEKNLTSGTPRTQNRKRMNFYTPATAEVREFATDEKALIDAFGNLQIVVLVDRNGDGIVSDDEASDNNGDGTIATGENLTGFPDVYATENKDYYVDSAAIKTGKLSKVGTTAFGVRAGVVIYSAGAGKSASSNKIAVTDGVFSW